MRTTNPSASAAISARISSGGAGERASRARAGEVPAAAGRAAREAPEVARQDGLEAAA
jgi:ribosomal protein S11